MLIDHHITPDDRHIIIFTHVPKCAGSSLREHVRKERGTALLTPYKQPLRKEFLDAETIEDEGITFLCSHDPYGIHKKFTRIPLYLTLLREPVERILSWYYFLVDNANHPLHTTIKNLSLNEAVQYFIEHKTPLFINEQCRFISNRPLFAPAKKNIDDHYFLAATVSQLAPFMDLLQHYGIIRETAVGRINVTPNKPKQPEVDDATLDRIRTYNQEDLQLYHYVESEFRRVAHEFLP